MTDLPAIGSRVFYTGDRANPDTWTTVTAHREPTRFSGKSVDLLGENGHTFLAIGPTSWAPGAGRRFILEPEYIANREAAIARMKADVLRLTKG